jgi:hypothetical protein
LRPEARTSREASGARRASRAGSSRTILPREGRGVGSSARAREERRAEVKRREAGRGVMRRGLWGREGVGGNL